ncbi:hypothetical protein B0H14DRAFT_2618186 [Mycena olivaceomarginata]|nr:hypothetical protein B0H14DRAFT_2618186 [Mycena olivaceomarginata]
MSSAPWSHPLAPLAVALPSSAPALPPVSFVERDLPYAVRFSESDSLITGSLGAWFSSDPPITDVNVVFERPLPSRAVLDDLLQQFGQFWLDGKKAIVDPRFNNGADRFPLWVLTLWARMGQTCDAQNQWCRAITFLQTRLTHPDRETSRRRPKFTQDAVNLRHGVKAQTGPRIIQMWKRWDRRRPVPPCPLAK